MASEGFVLDRFYAAAPVCSPTRASVMTGRNPIRTKVTNHGRYMRPHEQTIAESLQAAGYVTGIFGKVHLGSGQPDSPCNPTGMGFDEWVIGLNFFDNDPYLSRNERSSTKKARARSLPWMRPWRSCANTRTAILPCSWWFGFLRRTIRIRKCPMGRHSMTVRQRLATTEKSPC